jgi:poly(3-hydroxybutyrate) depolymerase
MKRAFVLFSALSLALFAALPGAARSKDKVQHLSFTFNNHPRNYSLLVPESADPSKPLPAVVLLHPQGGWASDVMGLWSSYANRTGFIAIAPESLSNTEWNSQADGPDFLHAVVADAAKKHPIDPSRVYLFGQDSGGVYALAIGIYDSGFWGATCVDGALLDPSNYTLFQHAVRKEPFEDWVGSDDPDDRIDLFTNQLSAFKRAGFPFELKVIPNSPGVYGNVYDEVNEGCWKFYSRYTLATNPKP